MSAEEKEAIGIIAQGHGLRRRPCPSPSRPSRARSGAGGRSLQAPLRDIHRRPRLPRVRLDHGQERGLLQVHELRGDVGLQLEQVWGGAALGRLRAPKGARSFLTYQWI